MEGVHPVDRDLPADRRGAGRMDDERFAEGAAAENIDILLARPIVAARSLRMLAAPASAMLSSEFAETLHSLR